MCAQSGSFYRPYENDFWYQKLNYTPQKVRAQIQFCFLRFFVFNIFMNHNHKVVRLMKRRHFKYLIRNCFAHFYQIKWKISIYSTYFWDEYQRWKHFRSFQYKKKSIEVKNGWKFSLTRHIKWRALMHATDDGTN